MFPAAGGGGRGPGRGRSSGQDGGEVAGSRSLGSRGPRWPEPQAPKPPSPAVAVGGASLGTRAGAGRGRAVRLGGRGLTSREDACLPSDSGEQTRARTFPSGRPATKPNLPPLPFSDARRRPQPLGLGLTAPAGTDGSAPARGKAERPAPCPAARRGKLLAWRARSRPALRPARMPGGPVRPAHAEPPSFSRVWGTRPCLMWVITPHHPPETRRPPRKPPPVTSAATADAAWVGP